MAPYLARGGMRRAFLEVGASTLAGKLVSGGKEIAVARFFGVSAGVDGYGLALSLVGAIQSIISVAIRPSLLPMLMEASKEGANRERRLAAHTGLAIAAGGTAIAIALPDLFARMQPSLLAQASPRTLQEAVPMLDLLRWGVPLSLLTLWAGTILERHKRFVAPTLAEAAPAVGILALLPAAAGILHERALALGTVAGVAGSAVALAALALSTGTVARRPAEARGFDTLLLETGRRFVPMLGAGLFVSLINLTDSLVAAWQGEGAVATMGYAQRVMALFLGISGAIIARVGLPYMAERFQQSDAAGQQLLNRLVRLGALAGLGMAAPLALFCQPLVALLFQRGAFTTHDTVAVAGVLFALTWQLPFYFAYLVQTQTLAARGMQSRIFAVGMANCLLNAALDVVLARYLGVAGIAWATTAVVAAATLTTAWLARRPG
jgi:putative peptidoglycan lipid II flippase